MPEPAFDESIPPYQMFEKIFTIEEIERICEESNKYAQSKGNHVFKMTPERLWSFCYSFVEWLHSNATTRYVLANSGRFLQ